MSDDERSSDDRSFNGNSGGDNICRDFLRNVCRRGNSCKFQHPEGSGTDQVGKKNEFIFCHDYQNRECHRINCKFVHCTRQEEQHYWSTVGASEKNNDTPVCKDFLKGDCTRGHRCRFRHLNNSEFDMGNGRDQRDRFERFDRFDFEPEAKRRAFGDPFHSSIMERGGMGLGPGNSLGGLGMTSPFYNFRILEEDNMLLRRKVEELKKQIADLTATNEFLLDQNAQLRLSKQNTVSHSIASMSQMPLNNDLSSRNMASDLGQAMPASMASVSMAQNMMSMSTPSTNLVSYPIMTQSMRPIIPHGMGH